MPSVAVAGRADRVQTGKAFEEDAEGGLHFEPRQRGADAEMDAGAEADVGIRRAGGFEGAGARELVFVAVGRTEEKADLVALPQLEALVFEVLEGVATEHVERGIEAEHFLGASDRVVEEVGGACMAENGLHAIAERVDGGLMARVEEKNRGGDQFVIGQRGAVRIPGRHKLGKKVAARTTAPLREMGAHVFAERDRGGDGAVLDGAVAARLIHRDHVV